MPSCGSDTCSCGDNCGCAEGACDCVCLSSLPVSHTSRRQMWLTKFAEVTVTSQADKCAHRVLPLWPLLLLTLSTAAAFISSYLTGVAPFLWHLAFFYTAFDP